MTEKKTELFTVTGKKRISPAVDHHATKKVNRIRFSTNKQINQWEREKEKWKPNKASWRKRKSIEITVRLMRSEEMRKQWRFINRICIWCFTILSNNIRWWDTLFSSSLRLVIRWNILGIYSCGGLNAKVIIKIDICQRFSILSMSSNRWLTHAISEWLIITSHRCVWHTGMVGRWLVII